MAAPKTDPEAKAPPQAPSKKRTPQPARGKDAHSVDPADGRVHAHIDIFSVGYGDFEVDQNSDGVEVSEDERTWSFPAPVEVAMHLIETQELLSTHPAGVPLTNDEQRAAADLEAKGNVESGKLAMALAQMARDKVASGGE